MRSIFLLFMLCSCNYTITMIHTEGSATDIVDETQSAEPSTALTVPGGASIF